MKSANTPKDQKYKSRGSRQANEIMYDNELESILEERSDGRDDRRYDMSPVQTQRPVNSTPSATLLSKYNFKLKRRQPRIESF